MPGSTSSAAACSKGRRSSSRPSAVSSAKGSPPDRVTMRVLLWYWGRHGGGVSYTWHLARALAAEPGLEVSLSLSRQNEAWDRFASLGLPIHSVDTYTGKLSALLALARLPLVARSFKRLIERERIDCVLG